MRINPQEITYGVAAVSGAGTTTFAWLVNVNEILQFVALVVSIGAGIAAWRWHRAKRKALDKDE